MSLFIIIFIYFICFFILSLIFLLISAYSSIYALLALILIAFCIVGLLLILQMDWFGLLLGIIYLGSIIVLFLFVIMLLKIQINKINYKVLIAKLFIFLFFLSILYFFFFFDIVKTILKWYMYLNTTSILLYTTAAFSNIVTDHIVLFDTLIQSKESNIYSITDLFLLFYTNEGGFILLILLWLLFLVLIGITNILTLLKDKNLYSSKLKIKINRKLN